MIEGAALTLSRRIGRLTLVAALGTLAACVAIDDGSEVPGDDEIAEMDETERALAPGDDDVTQTEPEPGNVNYATRYQVGDGACHTFDYLRYWSNWYCGQVIPYCGGGISPHAVNRNYTHGCTGWWGAGAKYVWFSCSCAVPI